ncbi:MAG TPA: Rieske 2Fe-2S domain-containing protein [Candidatus Nitrosocosmicus sp.]|nr:Rieske 2Fe-2S domain-containing protein [Candidatus Nitrosocosmicus sp.]
MAKFLIDKTSNFAEGKLRNITLGGKEILVINKGGHYFAINNICSHAGAELHKGTLEKNELACPWHGARWNVETGELLWFSHKLRNQEAYRVIVENNNVFVEI